MVSGSELRWNFKRKLITLYLGGIEFWDMRKASNSGDYSSIHKMASVQLPAGSEEYCMRVDSTKFFCSAHRQFILQCDMFKILQGTSSLF